MKKILTFGAATLAVVSLIGVSGLSVSALSENGTESQVRTHQSNGQGNGRQTSLESRAKVVGMSVDELESELETKTMSQIAVERGLSEDAFRAKMTEAAKARWEARGLSSTEIADRLAERETRHSTNAADHEFGSGEGNHQGGYGRNR